MRRLTLSVQPFVYNQTILIYNDDQLESTHLTPIMGIEAVVISMCKNKDIHQVDIRGERSFTEKIKEKILGLDKYEKTSINVNLY